MLTLYENIKKLREEKGMSQDTLAKLTGYTDRSSITKIEKGQVDLQQSKIELFAKALGTTKKALVGWDNPMPDAIPEIMDYYNILNDIGKSEATKRVRELSYFPEYTTHAFHDTPDYLAPVAAHNDAELTDEELVLMEQDIKDIKGLE